MPITRGMKSMIKIVLFDIDGTLISTGRAGTRAMNIAFRELFGPDNGFEGVPMAGRTDPMIIRDGLEAHGISAVDGTYTRYINTYLEHLKREMVSSPGKKVMPGILEILESLNTRSRGPVLGLLTGNIEAGARIKLQNMGLWHYFSVGAFGSDHDDRDRLLDVALGRCRDRLGLSFRPEETMVVGDTPKDIACSKPFGATAVAVATGPYSTEELAAHNPDHLFHDLSDPAPFLKLFPQG